MNDRELYPTQPLEGAERRAYMARVLEEMRKQQRDWDAFQLRIKDRPWVRVFRAADAAFWGRK